VAETYFPFDAGPGATVTEAQWSKMARLWRKDGVIHDPDIAIAGYRCAVTADGSGMHVFVNGGIAWIQGFYYENSANLTLPIAAADSQDRIDRITLRLDTTANSIHAHVTKGTPSGSPVAPALAAGPILWDIPLALVAVDSTATNIDAPDITDVREYADIDAATLDGIDSTGFLQVGALADAVPDAETFGQGGVIGVSADVAREDHGHAMPTHTKDDHDALNIDADTLDGHDSTDFAVLDATIAAWHGPTPGAGVQVYDWAWNGIVHTGDLSVGPPGQAQVNMPVPMVTIVEIQITNGDAGAFIGFLSVVSTTGSWVMVQANNPDGSLAMDQDIRLNVRVVGIPA
jgi:hypothetical protein